MILLAAEKLLPRPSWHQEEGGSSHNVWQDRKKGSFDSLGSRSGRQLLFRTVSRADTLLLGPTPKRQRFAL